MGKNNSSKCVVQPIFKAMLKAGTIDRFLSMVLPQGIETGAIEENDVWFDGHEREKVIKPVDSFLEWCRKNPDKLVCPEKAVQCLEDNPRYKFEGGTHPDVYIECDKCIVVIEAKWTEPRITSKTKWRKEGERDQLIRHMDALGDGDKDVYGLFLIDEYQKISKPVLEGLFKNDWYWQSSLPHRVDDGTWEKLKHNFCGVWTWQDVCAELNVELPSCLKEEYLQCRCKRM